MQQLMSVVTSAEDRHRAVQEAFRVLRPGGALVASFLACRARRQVWLHRLVDAHLFMLRKLTFRRRSMQYLPWLRLNNAPNLGALIDRGPYSYWFREQEAVELFTDAGFKIVAIGSGAQVAAGHFFDSPEELYKAPFSGALYFVCQKTPCASSPFRERSI